MTVTLYLCNSDSNKERAEWEQRSGGTALRQRCFGKGQQKGKDSLQERLEDVAYEEKVVALDKRALELDRQTLELERKRRLLTREVRGSGKRRRRR